MNVSNSQPTKRLRLSLEYEEHLRLSKKLKVCSSPPVVPSEVKVSEKVEFWESKTESGKRRHTMWTTRDRLHKAMTFTLTSITCTSSTFVAFAFGLMELLMHLLSS